jgi:hypothetical protein
MTTIRIVTAGLSDFAERLVELDFPIHAAALRMIVLDLERIARLEEECFRSPEVILDILLGKLDGGGLEPNGKNGRKP